MECFPFDDSTALNKEALILHVIIAIFWIAYGSGARNTKVIFEMQFVERDPNISFWVNEGSDQVPVWMLYFLSIFIPSVYILFVVIFLMRGKSSKVRFFAFLWYSVGLLETIFMTMSFFNTFKFITGKLRPNFFALCNYAGYLDALNSGNYTSYYSNTSPGQFGTFSKCLADPADFQDSRKSFLSGHAAISFCGMFYTSLLASSGFWNPKVWWYHLRVLVFIPPLYLSSWIGITRIQDKEHYTEDVLAGALLGIFVAWWNFTAIKAETDQLKIGPSKGSDITLSGRNG